MELFKLLQGYRTFIATGSALPLITEGVHVLLVPYLASHGIVLDPSGEAWLVGLGMAAVTVAMRFVTSTKVFSREATPVAPAVQPPESKP